MPNNNAPGPRPTELDAAKLLQRAAFGPTTKARDAWIAWLEHYSLDDTPGWATPLLPAIGANLADLADVERVDDSARLSGLAKREWYISSRTSTAYNQAKTVLSNTGIDAILGGGLALSSSWPTPLVRKLKDAALVVAPHELAESLTALSNVGYSVSNCTEPRWHQDHETVAPSGEMVRISSWLLGPKVVSPEREATWRSAFTTSRLAPDDLLILALGSRMLRPADEPDGVQWLADVDAAIRAGALTESSFREKVHALGLGALATALLKKLDQPSSEIDPSGASEFAAWKHGSKRHQFWHHPRLAAAAGRRFGPRSYLSYRQHLAQHAPA